MLRVVLVVDKVQVVQDQHMLLSHVYYVYMAGDQTMMLAVYNVKIWH